MNRTLAIIESRECVELYPTPQYTCMAWCPVKVQGQLYLYLQLNSVDLIFHEQTGPSANADLTT